MVAVIERGFEAHKNLWSPAQKDWIREDDMRMQIQTLALVLAHMEGEPIKRIIHQHLGGTGAVDPLAALQESPALRDAVSAVLAKAEYRTGGGKRAKERAAKKAAAPEITVS